MTDTVAPTGVDHVALNVPDVPGAIAFYTEKLGLTQNFTRPDFGFAGAWLDTANGQQVHLIELPAPPNWASTSPWSMTISTRWWASCAAAGSRCQTPSRSARRGATRPSRRTPGATGSSCTSGPAEAVDRPAQSPVVGSITEVTRETLSAGNPPQRACSKMMSSSGAT